MKKVALFFAALCLMSSSVCAQSTDIKPEDFAYGFLIQAGETSAPYVLTLPEHVYTGAYQSDLSDMMLFNARGEVVPFAIKRPEPEGKRLIEPQILPYYTVTAEKDNVTYIAEIIMDISELPARPSAITYTLAGTEEFNGTATIYYSLGNLNSWSSLKSENIAYLKSERGTIIRNEVIFNSPLSSNMRYLRMVTDPIHALPQIKEITAKFEPERIYEPTTYISVRGVVDRSTPDNASLTLPGFYPVEWINIKTPTSYLFPKFTLAVWQDKYQQYYPLYPNKTLSDYSVMPEISGTGVQDARYKKWMLQAPAALPAEGVEVDFYWRADELIFLTKGSGPYTLAYGNANYERKDRTYQSAEALKHLDVEAERIKGDFPRIEFAGDAALIKNESDIGSTSGKYILIGVLSLIVVVMSIITIRLIMDINRKKD